MNPAPVFRWLVSEPPDRARPLSDHLVELRRRLLWSLGVAVTATVVGSFYTRPFFESLSRSTGPLVFLTPTGAFLARLKMAIFLGVFVSAPVMLYHLWRFVAVALSVRERRALMAILPASYALFVGGVCLGWFFVLPAGLRFLMACANATLKPMISVESALSFSLWTCLGLGFLFQFPVVLVALSRWGIILPETLVRYRRVAFILILVAAAIVTPGPDILTQLLLALPTYVLYEVSLWVARWVRPRSTPID
ncbi:MAG: twin-arginine translocase subunit TatC [Elusimicrobia bacterium]|nr:twin-arginine translocase subunit TatC [Elusimicrobiota bacterium]